MAVDARGHHDDRHVAGTPDLPAHGEAVVVRAASGRAGRRRGATTRAGRAPPARPPPRRPRSPRPPARGAATRRIRASSSTSNTLCVTPPSVPPYRHETVHDTSRSVRHLLVTARCRYPLESVAARRGRCLASEGDDSALVGEPHCSGGPHEAHQGGRPAPSARLPGPAPRSPRAAASGDTDPAGAQEHGEPGRGRHAQHARAPATSTTWTPTSRYYSRGLPAPCGCGARQLFTYPADERPDHDRRRRTWPTRSRPPTTAASARTARPTRSSSGDGAKWNTSPARPVTAEDLVRGVKRTCNPVQPFGGIPDFATLIEGYQDFCDGFAKAGRPRPGDRRPTSTATTCPAWWPRTTRPSFHAHPARRRTSSDMLTLPAFSAGARGGAQVPAGQPGARQAPGLRRSLPDRVAGTPTKSIVFTRNPAWDALDRPGPEGVRRQDRGQRDGQPGLGAAAARRPARRAPTWRSGPSRRRPSCRAYRRERPQPEPRRDHVHEPVRRRSTPSRRTTTRR